jgi:hypothetical protein
MRPAVDAASGDWRTPVPRAGVPADPALHRRGKILRLRGFDLSAAEAHDLIASPAYIVAKAAEGFKDKTTAPNQLWQTDFSVPQQAACDQWRALGLRAPAMRINPAL